MAKFKHVYVKGLKKVSTHCPLGDVAEIFKSVNFKHNLGIDILSV